MLQINCPCCGLRDENEFGYRGDASIARPDADAPLEAFAEYVYQRANLRGIHSEWWIHVGGCRQVLKIERDTATHAIVSVALTAKAPKP